MRVIKFYDYFLNIIFGKLLYIINLLIYIRIRFGDPKNNVNLFYYIFFFSGLRRLKITSFFLDFLIRILKNR